MNILVLYINKMYHTIYIFLTFKVAKTTNTCTILIFIIKVIKNIDVYDLIA